MSWDGQQVDFTYDKAGRHTVTDRNTGQLTSTYTHDANGRLRQLRHETVSAVMAEFAYTVDQRGNRTIAKETVRLDEAETILDTDPRVIYEGNWTSNQTDDSNAILRVSFADINPVLTMGEGPNYSMYDIYINGAYYQMYDGYAAANGTRQIAIPLENHGPHEIEIRNRPQHSYAARSAWGFDPNEYTLRFEQLDVDGNYDVRTIQYAYDGIARLLEARHNPGLKRDIADSALWRRYLYEYDLAGNRTREVEAVDGATNSDITYSYNDKNQLIDNGISSCSYDDNGNLTSGEGTTYGWDQANRMTFQQRISHVWETYEYDGAGNRVRRTNSVVVPPDPPNITATEYLMDVQASLPNVISATTNGFTTQYIHGPRGIQAREDSSGNWTWMLQDGLGSVRGSTNNAFSPQVETYHMYEPYGDRYAGNFADFGFTGEQTDINGLLYLRARYYNPIIGIFTALDPFEGTMQRPMSLNGYSWVEGNTPNRVDPSGMVIVDIWVAAFIADNVIEFPFAADPTADWHGDGRSWHTLADFGNPPLSSRAWWSIRFDTNDLSTMTSRTDTGATSVTYGGLLGVYTSHGKAPSPAPATVECTGPDSDDPFIISDVWVQIEENAKNPLISMAPPIEIGYSILIMPQTGQINVTRDIDRYPWHELHIAVDGVSVVQLHYSPPGPLKNPADLSLGSRHSVFTNIGSFPADGPCKSSQNQSSLPIPMPTPTLPVRLPSSWLDCLFP